jgi:hypothetical protein
VKPGILLLLMVLACSPSQTVTPTPTNPPSTPTTSTAPVTVTTSSAPTTSTTAQSTTTTLIGSGELPFIVGGAGLIGYFDGSHWVQADLETPVVGGEVYRVFDLAGELGTSVGSEIEICEPAGTPLIELNPPLLTSAEAPGEVAITGASWQVAPRLVDQTASPPPDLVDFASQFLADRGLEDPAPDVAQYLTVDIDADGSDEEILVAKRIPPNLNGTADSYSLVIMRKQLDVEPAILIVSYSQGTSDSIYVVSHYVVAVIDLNGDDQLELVIDGRYYEGSFTSVYEYIDDDLGLIEVLTGACGA